MKLPEPATEPNLTCPYTGEELIPEYHVGVHGHYCTGGLDPAQAFKTEADLQEALRQRAEGPKWAKNRPLICMYTGKTIEVVAVDGKFYAKGAFSPRKMFGMRSHSLYAVSTRLGVAPAFEREIRVQVGEPLVPQPHPYVDKIGQSETVDPDAVAKLAGFGE